MSAYPTPWQKRTMWAALTALFVVLLIVIAGAVVYVGANLISFLQPILIPVAIAVILAYLLDPLVTELCRRKMGRSEEHTSELQSRFDLVCRLLLEKKKKK